MVTRTRRNATLNANRVGFDPRLSHVGFVVKKMSNWLNILRVLWFSSVGVIPLAPTPDNLYQSSCPYDPLSSRLTASWNKTPPCVPPYHYPSPSRFHHQYVYAFLTFTSYLHVVHAK
jgi:hypothetical protein